MKIEVVNYRSIWEEKYNQEAKRIKYILGDLFVNIYHIGSTSVKGLKAKPIIDIMVVVAFIDKVDEFNSNFEALGYECMGEYKIPGRRYFRKGGDKRTHQIHIFEETNLFDIERHLAVRDYLRTHHAVAVEYGRLKERLASEFPNDIEGYSDGKDSFIKNMEQEALAWYRLEKNIDR